MRNYLEYIMSPFPGLIHAIIMSIKETIDDIVRIVFKLFHLISKPFLCNVIASFDAFNKSNFSSVLFRGMFPNAVTQKAPAKYIIVAPSIKRNFVDTE